jgi:hypothetical protein
MFGGLAFATPTGNLAFAIRGDELLMRVPPAQRDELMRRDGIHAAVMGTRTMQGWLQAGGAAIAADNLTNLLTLSYDYALSLPSK